MFGNPSIKAAVNNATHSWIFKQISKQIYEQMDSFTDVLPNWLKISNTDAKIVILDAPLLFETKIFSYITAANVCISVPEPIQLERLMKRNNLTEVEAKQRVAAQMKLEDKCKLADLIIDNSKDLKHLEEEIDKVVQKIKAYVCYYSFTNADCNVDSNSNVTSLASDLSCHKLYCILVVPTKMSMAYGRFFNLKVPCKFS